MALLGVALLPPPPRQPFADKLPQPHRPPLRRPSPLRLAPLRLQTAGQEAVEFQPLPLRCGVAQMPRLATHSAPLRRLHPPLRWKQRRRSALDEAAGVAPLLPQQPQQPFEGKPPPSRRLPQRAPLLLQSQLLPRPRLQQFALRSLR